MLNQETLREAARLTRAGQLTEAKALLQRMFSGERVPAAESRAPGPRRPSARQAVRKHAGENQRVGKDRNVASVVANIQSFQLNSVAQRAVSHFSDRHVILPRKQRSHVRIVSDAPAF